MSYAPSRRVGPKGLEPSPTGLKVRCAAVTPRPRNAGRAYAFPSGLRHRHAPHFPVVALRVELSATRLSAGFGQPALDYRVPTSLSVRSGWQDSNLRSCVPTTNASRRCPAGSPLPYIPSSVRTGGFEPPISWPPASRDTRLRYVLPSAARTGVEPVFPA